MDIYEPLGISENAQYLRNKASEHIEGLKVVLRILEMIDDKFPFPDGKMSESNLSYNDAFNAIKLWIDDKLFGIKPIMTAAEIIGKE